jgi:hypothetical protein
MLLYFAGAENENHYRTVTNATNNANLLFSYYGLRGKSLDFIDHTKFKKSFLDSGAYSAMTKNTVIPFDEYLNFCKETKDHWTTINGLDVIGDYKATAENQEKMESSGIHSMPTFHVGSPIEELHKLCQKYDYIALGGLVPYSLNPKFIREWLDYCFSVIKLYWPKKVHAFGVNSFKLWLEYPFYSVDATSYIMVAQKFAGVQIFHRGKLLKFSGFGNRMNEKELELLKKKAPGLILQYKDRDGQNNYIERTNVTIRSLQEAADYATEVWKQRGITWDD